MMEAAGIAPSPALREERKPIALDTVRPQRSTVVF
jgi:hypothetical protein